mgnify:CR=1 FL=1
MSFDGASINLSIGKNKGTVPGQFQEISPGESSWLRWIGLLKEMGFEFGSESWY